MNDHDLIAKLVSSRSWGTRKTKRHFFCTDELHQKILEACGDVPFSHWMRLAAAEKLQRDGHL